MWLLEVHRSRVGAAISWQSDDISQYVPGESGGVSESRSSLDVVKLRRRTACASGLMPMDASSFFGMPALEGSGERLTEAGLKVTAGC